ncbi:MAG TPA: HD family hydrolase [Anaerolineae bacterium]|nr:HD family hydrolase [Anaerolineae bacterium]
MTSHDDLLNLLLEAATLKRVPRTGWGMRGVPHVESVAEHSFGVAFVALALTDLLEEPLDREKVLIMALLHDLAEVRLTDLPISAVRLLPAEIKSRAEAEALADLLAPLPGGERLRALWQEFEDRTSPEGRLVRDADKLEMMIQCLRYEQAGSRGLDEFWAALDRREWHYPLCAALYARLRAMRPGLGDATVSGASP